MQLTVRGWLLLLAAAPLIALATWLPVASWLAGGWLLVATALFIVDARATPTARAWTLTRRHETRLSLAAHNRITVQIARFPQPGRSGRSLDLWGARHPAAHLPA